ncbi:MAG: sulfate adenylyltransferase [Firmicutes bacterium]|nr:sulfate adenylyltransferase [Bacillota bacterium]
MTADGTPHGGELVDRELRGDEREEWRRRAREWPGLRLPARALADVFCLATGVYSPLRGFLDRRDYFAVLDDMRLASGVVWSLPVTLAVPPDTAADLDEGRWLRLEDGAGRAVAVLRVEDRFRRDPEYEARRVYGTADPVHPGVARLYREPRVLIGGGVWLLERPVLPGVEDGAAHLLEPAATRREFARRGWRRVVGFQTRNPVHRAHEYIQKCSLEMADGLLLHPLVGETREDDVPAEIRMQSYRVLIERYFPQERVVLAPFPAAMRYAGPREALFHALCRKNYGCTHFIVGRDHAGVGSFYGPFDAQRIFERFAPEELGITPLCFDNAFYCRRCQGMATARSCPHSPEYRVSLSGTRVREMLRRGETPPPEVTRPEVAAVLAEAMAARTPVPEAIP